LEDDIIKHSRRYSRNLSLVSRILVSASNNMSCLSSTIRVPNSPTGQVLEAGPDWPAPVDVDDWTRLTWVVQSSLDWFQTGLYKRSHESLNGIQANPR